VTLPTETAADQPPPRVPDDLCPNCRADISGSWLSCAGCGTGLATSAALTEGARLADRFKVRSVLGRGGFGITYEVDDERLERRVAVKELFPESAVRHGSVVLTPPQARTGFADAKERFLREARTLARFSHPGIVRVFEVFEAHNTAYLVLELVDGPSLADVLRERGRPLGTDEVLDIAARAAGALIAVHEAGMLHRDLSPSNLVCTPSGRIVLIDFGLAKAYTDDPAATMTRIVTPGYAPLEQYLGKGPFGPTTDVYGLSATMYRLLTGQPPVAAIDRSAGKPLSPPHRVNPDVPKMVSDAVMDGLELQAEHRPPTIVALLARLGVDRPAHTSVVMTPPSEEATRLDPRAGSSPPRNDAGAPPAPGAWAAAAAAGQAQPSYPPGVGGQAQPSYPPGVGGQAQPSYPPADGRAQPSYPPAAANPAPSPVHHPGQIPPAGSVYPAQYPAASYPPAGAGYPGPVQQPMRQSVVGAPGRPPTAVIGPSPAGSHGRWKATLPLAVAAVSLGSAAPVLIAIVLVVVAMPALATLGDYRVHIERQRAGQAAGWLGRRPAGAAAPLHVAKNLLVSLYRSLLPVAFLASMVALSYLLEKIKLEEIEPFWLRATGAATALMLVKLGSTPGRIRSSEGLDDVLARITTPTGRLTQAGWVLWIVCIGLTAGGLFLTPDPFPFPR